MKVWIEYREDKPMRMLLATALGALSLVAWEAPAEARDMVPCAGEGGYCRVPYPTRVVYGANGRFASREVGPRGIPCNNGVFGDPIFGVRKHCAYEARGRGGDFGHGGGGRGYGRGHDGDYPAEGRRHRDDRWR